MGTLLYPDGSLEGSKESAPDELRIDCVRRVMRPPPSTTRYPSAADSRSHAHDANSRKGFALGAVLAAEYTATHRGLLTISDMFHF